MSRLIVDARVAPIERLDRSRAVLVSGHSLEVIATQLETSEVPWLTPRQLVEEPGGPHLANVIQTIVLHDALLVDSVLFDIGTVSHAHELFPDVIKGVFIRDSMREQVGERLDAMPLPAWRDKPPAMSLDDWHRWLLLDSSEKPMMDRIDKTPPRLIPAEYACDAEITRALDRIKPVWTGIPSFLLNSGLTVARAHFYLELARELRVPLSLDPVRSTYLRPVIDDPRMALVSPVPEEFISDFEAQVSDESEVHPIIFDVDIPPVAEYVLHYAQCHRTSLRTATLEVRDSKNARNFRDWCARLFALRDEGGLRAKVESKRIVSDFKKACDAWASDVGEGVDFQRRKLKLGDIPLVGKVLSAAGMAELCVKDPILRPKSRYRYFLFLNDLLRAPGRAAGGLAPPAARR